MGEGRSISQRKAAVVQRLTLSTVVEPHVKLSGSPGASKRRGKCPFHGSNSPSLALFDADSGTGSGTCFGCQWQGDLFRFLMDIRGIDFMTALAEAEALAGIGEAPAGEQGAGTVQRVRNPVPPRPRSAPERIAPIDMGRWIWRHARRNDPATRHYLLGRGVPGAALTAERLAGFRYLADCPCSPWVAGADPRSEPVAPALVALVERPERREAGEFAWRALGVHVTYLSPGGEDTMRRRKPWARDDDPDPWLPKRRMLGPVGGGAVLLGEYRPDAALFVGEGNETVLSAIGLAGCGPDVVGVATLSLDNLQGAPRLWRNRTWPLHMIEPDPERPCFTIPGHRAPVTGLVDSDMSPLRGRVRPTAGRLLESERGGETPPASSSAAVGPREYEGEAVIERKGGPIVRRAITGAERARICGELFVKGWRGAGVADVSAVRAPAGMDFNDAARAVAA